MTQVRIPLARVRPWLTNFATRHGQTVYAAGPDGLEATAADGAHALLRAGWEPWQATGDPVDSFVDYLALPRRFGVILARKSAHSVGVAEGLTLVASKTDSHYVQGRTKAGGWSQQRYARRRGNQASKAFADAADDAHALLVPLANSLDYVITGGEATAIESILVDPRLRPLTAIRDRLPHKVWPTVDPKRAVLEAFLGEFQSVAIDLNDAA